MSKPRPVTPDELRDKILLHMKHLSLYWANLDRDMSIYDRIEGALFSTLAMLDGCCIDIPGFDLVPKTHEDDKQWHIDRGENWIEEGTVISDELHSYWNSI